MTSILYILTELFNWNLLKVKNKKNQITIITMCIIWVFMGLNIYNADYLSYEFTYYLAPHISFIDEIEVGYLLLEKISNFMGLNFIQFRGILYLVALLIIKKTIDTYSDNYYYVIFFYMIYGMFIDSIQFRNFLAMSIVIFSIKYLFGESRNIWKYSLLILMASSIHATSLIYLVFILIRKRYIKVISFFIIFSAILMSFTTVVNGNNIPFLSDLLISTQNTRLLRYFDTHTTLGFVFPMLLHLYNIFILYICTKISRDFEKNSHNYIVDNSLVDIKKIRIIKFAFWANLLLMIIMPFYVININFYRFVRNLHIINLIAYSNTNNMISKNRIIKISFNILVLVNTFSWFYIDYILLNDFSIVQDIFNFNLLF